jgi:hypothetical protein
MNRYIGTVAEMGGVPAILAPFHHSMKALIQWSARYVCRPGEDIYYPDPPRCSIHDVARNIMVETMRGDWLLMLDTDHSFEPDLLYRLINLSEQTGADVVTGMYQYRQPPRRTRRCSTSRRKAAPGRWATGTGAPPPSRSAPPAPAASG